MKHKRNKTFHSGTLDHRKSLNRGRGCMKTQIARTDQGRKDVSNHQFLH